MVIFHSYVKLPEGNLWSLLTQHVSNRQKHHVKTAQQLFDYCTVLQRIEKHNPLPRLYGAAESDRGPGV